MTDEQRAERLHWHMYDSCEGIREHAERIVALEELVGELYEIADTYPEEREDFWWKPFEERMAALGIEARE